MKYLALIAALWVPSIANAFDAFAPTDESIKCWSLSGKASRILATGGDSTFLKNYIQSELSGLYSKKPNFDLDTLAMDLVVALHLEFFEMKQDQRTWLEFNNTPRGLVYISPRWKTICGKEFP